MAERIGHTHKLSFVSFWHLKQDRKKRVKIERIELGLFDALAHNIVNERPMLHLDLIQRQPYRSGSSSIGWKFLSNSSFNIRDVTVQFMIILGAPGCFVEETPAKPFLQAFSSDIRQGGTPKPMGYILSRIRHGR